MNDPRLVLASASPRRRELLAELGLHPEVRPPNVDETPHADESPDAYVTRLAFEKAGADVQADEVSLGADTVVVLGETILGKPKDTAEAAEMLHRLSGHSHRVITGFCIHDLRKNKEGVQAVATEVRFKRLTATEIEKYIAVGESMDKAGAYAVQGVGAYLVDSMSGSYTNVVGLPLCQTVEMMEEMGAHDILPY